MIYTTVIYYYRYLNIDGSNDQTSNSICKSGRRNTSPSSDEDCGSDEHPVSIDGTIECIGEGDCKSYQFNGKEVKHCNTR
jgi:hypothetical protein